MVERRFEGATALVTGASSGIGHAIARLLAERGARVLLVGRDADRLGLVRAGLPAPERHDSLSIDLADTGAIERLTDRALHFCAGQLSVLVHSAGAHAALPLEETDGALFDSIIATNLRAPFLLTAALLPALRAARGDVVFINSSVVTFPRADAAVYAASKAGLRAFADCLRAAVNPAGVRVLSVFPGRTATTMQREHMAREGLSYRPELLLQPEEVASAVVSAIGLAETAELTELQIRPRLKT